MTVRLTLLVHGATVATRQARFPADEPLADPRPREAAPASFAQVRQGPEIRCRQTAELLGHGATTDPGLADWRMGDWAGTGPPEEEVAAWLADPAFAPPGGESLEGVLRRTAAWLDGLPPLRGRMLAITHPAIVRAAVLHALAAPPACFWRIDAAPLSVTRLSRTAGRWRLRETGHRM